MIILEVIAWKVGESSVELGLGIKPRPSDWDTCKKGCPNSSVGCLGDGGVSRTDVTGFVERACVSCTRKARSATHIQGAEACRTTITTHREKRRLKEYYIHRGTFIQKVCVFLYLYSELMLFVMSWFCSLSIVFSNWAHRTEVQAQISVSIFDSS